MEILKMMLKNDMTYRIMMKEEEKDHYLYKKIKKVIGLMKKELGGKITTRFAAFAVKIHDLNYKKIVIKQKTQRLKRLNE